MEGSLIAALAAIVWVDLLLSGDNAVVIALVCRGLPANQQTLGMVLGTAGAIVLRIGMALAASFLLAVEGLSILGGLFLLWVAFGLIRDEADEDAGVKPSASLIGAIVAVSIADASMSLDNVMAIAALAKGHPWLMVFGITGSIPLVVIGAAIIKKVVDRFPWIDWLGAGLLAWVAGAIMLGDPILRLIPSMRVPIDAIPFCVACCASVLIFGAAYRKWRFDRVHRPGV